MKNRVLLTVLSAAALAGGADAAITYVDADLANTTIDGNAIVVGTNVTATRINTDNLWAYETNASFSTNSDSVFAAKETENAGTLATTVSGLAAGTYDVWAYYWAATDGPPAGQGWDITAQVGANAAVTETGGPTGANGTLASTQSFTNTVSFTGGNRVLHALYLGQVSGTSFTVSVDDPAGNDRTWYDGVGYQVVPEPGSLALLGLGGLAMLRRRRA